MRRVHTFAASWPTRATRAQSCQSRAQLISVVCHGLSCPSACLARRPVAHSHLVNGRGERLFAHELQEALASLGLDSFSLEDIKNFIHYYDRYVHI